MISFLLFYRALKYAVKIDIISVNPADKVERPKADKFIGSFYDSNEVQALFEAAKGTLIEIPFFLGAFYGLRRSEALGLKWDAIDFQNNTITIRHTVTSCNLDGKHIQIAQDTTKTKSSMRTLPLVPAFKEKLLKLKEQQEEYRRVCGRCYNKKYLEYICVDEMGTLISPHYLTSSFPKLLEKTICVTFVSTTSDTAAPHCFWQTMCLLSTFRSGWGTATSARRRIFTATWITSPRSPRQM